MSYTGTPRDYNAVAPNFVSVKKQIEQYGGGGSDDVKIKPVVLTSMPTLKDFFDTYVLPEADKLAGVYFPTMSCKIAPDEFYKGASFNYPTSRSGCIRMHRIGDLHSGETDYDGAYVGFRVFYNGEGLSPFSIMIKDAMVSVIDGSTVKLRLNGDPTLEIPTQYAPETFSQGAPTIEIGIKKDEVSKYPFGDSYENFFTVNNFSILGLRAFRTYDFRLIKVEHGIGGDGRLDIAERGYGGPYIELLSYDKSNESYTYGATIGGKGVHLDEVRNIMDRYMTMKGQLTPYIYSLVLNANYPDMNIGSTECVNIEGDNTLVGSIPTQYSGASQVVAYLLYK